jgi:hypothetical protein
MRRRSSLTLSLILLVMQAIALPSGASAHIEQCSSSSWTGYLVVFEHENYGGAAEDACGFDSNWYNGAGPIQNFHDRMTSFHFTDRSGDGKSVCIVFWSNADYSGAAFIANGGPMGGGQHFADANVGGFNDAADSHDWYFSSTGYC